MYVGPEDAAAGLLRCFPEGVRRGCAGGRLDPQRGPHRAFADGRAHSRRMGRRLRKSRMMISLSEPIGGFGELAPHHFAETQVQISISAVKRNIGRRAAPGVIFPTSFTRRPDAP